MTMVALWVLMSAMIYSVRQRNHMQNEEVYTMSEARTKLRMTMSVFKQYIDEGKIRKVIPTHGMRLLCSKEDVDRIAEKLKPFESITIELLDTLDAEQE